MRVVYTRVYAYEKAYGVSTAHNQLAGAASAKRNLPRSSSVRPSICGCGWFQQKQRVKPRCVGRPTQTRSSSSVRSRGAERVTSPLTYVSSSWEFSVGQSTPDGTCYWLPYIPTATGFRAYAPWIRLHRTQTVVLVCVNNARRRRWQRKETAKSVRFGSDDEEKELIYVNVLLCISPC